MARASRDKEDHVVRFVDCAAEDPESGKNFVVHAKVVEYIDCACFWELRTLLDSYFSDRVKNWCTNKVIKQDMDSVRKAL